MNPRDYLQAIGTLEILRFNAEGELVEHRLEENLVVDTGLAFIASRMVGNTPAVMSHMAVGTGTTAAAADQTALVTEAGRAALASASASGKVVSYSATFNAGVGTGALTEAAIFNGPNDGTPDTMLNRVVFAVVNKGSQDVVQINWTVTLA